MTRMCPAGQQPPDFGVRPDVFPRR